MNCMFMYYFVLNVDVNAKKIPSMKNVLKMDIIILYKLNDHHIFTMYKKLIKIYKYVF